MVTVFTPTYNRAQLLKKLYSSLLSQTCHDFEWLIIDDGSIDETESVCAGFIEAQNLFPIRYYKVENGGKHRAINKGVNLAQGEVFFIVDSDDYLADDAVEKIISWIKTLDNSRKFAGVAGLRAYQGGSPIGGIGDGQSYVDATNLERRKLNLLGDKAEAYFTDVLVKYPFPEFEGENFLTEEVVWNKIAADGYYIRWFSDPIYYCEYLDGGLTKSGDAKYINNPQGVLYWAKRQVKYFGVFKRERYSAIKTYCKAVGGKENAKSIAKDLNVSVFTVILVKVAMRLLKR